ncbi:hypothetical protein BV898_05405 [Hypsibius exemplaris]|uniref:Uncharacterized protein n=1 Tax=Hypsibius exemplaris TaxID=2072580 RepID=A0A1W0WZF1_HYPEX|nr:hypothetical protein BV898_05405 [Hypsibius exemplaris]
MRAADPSGRQVIQDPRQNNELLLTILLFWHNNHYHDDSLSPEQLAATCRSYLGELGGGTDLGDLVGGGVLDERSQLLSSQRTPCQVYTNTHVNNPNDGLHHCIEGGGICLQCTMHRRLSITIVKGCLAITQNCVVGDR